MAASLIGTAKPTPLLPPSWLAIAVSIPMTAPLWSASGPPLLPGLIGASVWIRLLSWPASSVIDRPRALTIPLVTVESRPNGLPTATTTWPTRSLSLSPRGRAVRLLDWMLTTAVSIEVSTPTTVPGVVEPSGSVTVTWLADPTTCPAVRIRPEVSTTKPEPRPSLVEIWTTPGRSFAAVSAIGSDPEEPELSCCGAAVGAGAAPWPLPAGALGAAPPPFKAAGGDVRGVRAKPFGWTGGWRFRRGPCSPRRQAALR